MVSRKPAAGQEDLFTTEEVAAPGRALSPAPEPGRVQRVRANTHLPPGARIRPAQTGARPEQVVPVLTWCQQRRYGLLENGGRPVWMDGDGNCRFTDAEPVVESLLREGYLRESDTVLCRHGAIGRTVVRLAVTPAGEKLRRRWAHLTALPGSDTPPE